MHTVATVAFTLVILFVLEAVLAYLVYLQKAQLFDRLQIFLGIRGLASSYLDVSDRVSRNERTMVAKFLEFEKILGDASSAYQEHTDHQSAIEAQLETQKQGIIKLHALLKEAADNGAEEVIDLGRRIDGVQDNVTALMTPAKPQPKKSRKSNR